jgi:hypothetical protein
LVEICENLQGHEVLDKLEGLEAEKFSEDFDADRWLDLENFFPGGVLGNGWRLGLLRLDGGDGLWLGSGFDNGLWLGSGWGRSWRGFRAEWLDARASGDLFNLFLRI